MDGNLLENFELVQQNLKAQNINEQIEQKKTLFKQIVLQTESLKAEIDRLEHEREVLKQESKEKSVNDCLFG